MNCYRFASDAVYEQVRSALDEAFGYPNNQTSTTVAPQNIAPRDSQGRIVLALKDSLHAGAVAAGVLPWQFGGVTEIDEATYRAATTTQYA